MEDQNPTHKIGYLVTHLASILARMSDQILLEQLGLGFSQFKIMLVLKNHPHIQQKQIAAALGQTEASISRQIKMLHSDGLITARVSKENRREHITTLTPKGDRFIEQSLKILTKHYEPLFGVLGKKQGQFIEQLEAIHTVACQCHS